MQNSENTSFSVIIPVYDEAAHIKKCIESVKANANEKTKSEIIIVDNGSTDGTIEIVKESGIGIIENTEGIRKNISVLRNMGAKASQGMVLAFLDADMIVPDNWLEKANAHFCDGFEGAVGFVEKAPSSAGWVGRVWGTHLSLKRDKAMNVDFLPGRNIFINRHVFEMIGGFNGTLRTAEDKDLTFRVLQAGFRVISVPDIAVIHLGYEKNLWEFLKKEFWRQGSTFQLAKLWGFSFRTLRNPIMSFWHISLFFAVIISIFTGISTYAPLLVSIWICPSMLIALSSVGSKKPSRFLLPLFVLTFLRWHASGLALLTQFIRKMPLGKI
jgi:glycosyltransferase involved in cell wall biosynthesis